MRLAASILQSTPSRRIRSGVARLMVPLTMMAIQVGGLQDSG
jgi:hypothetical protein